jgi:hypothetical protein
LAKNLCPATESRDFFPKKNCQDFMIFWLILAAKKAVNAYFARILVIYGQNVKFYYKKKNSIF